MLINLSNHPLAEWGEQQKTVAEQEFGPIVDLRFPNVEPEASLNEIVKEAKKYAQKCCDILGKRTKANNPSDRQDAIHVMGEMTFVFQFVRKMSEMGILCMASTTKRTVERKPDGKEIKSFQFVRFRPYTSELY